MNHYFAEAITLSESQSAGIALFMGAVFIGPLYLLSLYLGRRYRNKLVITDKAKWGYIFGLPLALGFVGLTGLFGSDEVANLEPVDSVQGNIFGLFSMLALIIGLVSLIYIVVRSLQARKNTRIK